MRNIAIFIGLVLGVIVSGFAGMLDLGAAGNAPAVSIITPFHFGMPTFHLVPIATMCLVVAITWVESIGDAIVVGDMVNRKPTAGTISDLIRADGLSTMLGGILNSFPYTAFSENVALVSITGVKSRWVVALAGGILVVVGLSPFLATTVAALPKPVVGGAGFMMFGTLVVVGMKTLKSVDLDASFKNFIVVGISVAMCMIPIMNDKFFHFMPNWSQVLFTSPLIMGAVTAIVLNILLNGVQAKNTALAAA
jgi:xanthine/uracil permease